MILGLLGLLVIVSVVTYYYKCNCEVIRKHYKEY